MKPRHLIGRKSPRVLVAGGTALAVVAALVAAAGPTAARAQEGALPSRDSRTRVQDGGGSAGVGVGRADPAPPATVTHLKLAPIREWRSADGRVIHAELMSWPLADPAAVSTKVEELEFDVVREGRIRLRREGRIFAVPLTRLSDADRTFVARLVERLEARETEEPASTDDGGEDQQAPASGESPEDTTTAADR